MKKQGLLQFLAYAVTASTILFIAMSILLVITNFYSTFGTILLCLGNVALLVISAKLLHMSRKNRERRLRKVFSLAIVFALTTLFTWILLLITPTPAVLLMRMVFSANSAHITPFTNFEETSLRVEIHHDLIYPSNFSRNTFDLYLPLEREEPIPVVIWAHGGGYIAGDKEEIRYYGTYLADAGFAVVAFHYMLAPQVQFPTPLMQMEELYTHLLEIAPMYSLDMERINFAGNSAGAHLVAQFALIQSNQNYAELINFEQTIPIENIRSTILFCGPFDVLGLANDISPNWLRWFLGRAMWSYVGTRNWSDDFHYILTISNHLTADFPPSFVTDANTFSFEEQAKELILEMENAGIPVTYFFVPISDETIYHEFQFDLASEIGVSVKNLVLEHLINHNQN